MSQCRLYVILLLLVATYVQAHERDYSYNGNEHDGYSFVEVDEEVWDDEVCEVYTYYYDSDALCVNCFFDVTWEDYSNSRWHSKGRSANQRKRSFRSILRRSFVRQNFV